MNDELLRSLINRQDDMVARLVRLEAWFKRLEKECTGNIEGYHKEYVEVCDRITKLELLFQEESGGLDG